MITPSSKLFKVSPLDVNLQHIFEDKLGISKVLAQLLINRGIKTEDEAVKFLEAKVEYLADPYSFADMHKAVALIRSSAAKKQKLLIFGDYDVDGITGLAVLKKALMKLGVRHEHYLPHRIKEGYGLSSNILKIARERDAKLLITVDCGTNSQQQIAQLRQEGIEVIITDHHEPSSQAPQQASAVINPKLQDSNYRFRDLAGVGVAYKLAQALTGEPLLDNLELVSLGTVADVVPLCGENRIIVKEGLARLPQSKNPGIRALLKTSGLRARKMRSRFIAFILGPRINASGRMDSAELSLRLLLSDSEEEALSLAGLIELHNRSRQKVESQMMQEAQELISSEVNFKQQRVIVVAKDDWHQGVLGIVAAKIAEMFYRPTILISKGGRLCKGSGRSIKGFHLFQALLSCSDFLESFGGHDHAAGLMIERDKIEKFKERINGLARERLSLQDLLPTIEADMEISLAQLSEEMVSELELLEPFGTANLEPLFYSRKLRLKGEPQFLARDTLKFWVEADGFTYEAIAFGMSGLKESIQRADYLDLVFTPKIDSWGGREGIILEVQDIFLRGS